MASKLKLKRVPVSKIKAPGVNPSGRTKQPRGFGGLKQKNTRGYSKVKPVPDPATEGGVSTGFGMTGLTGES